MNRRVTTGWLVGSLAFVLFTCTTSQTLSSAPREWHREGKGSRTLVMLGGGTLGAAMFEPHARELAHSFEVVRVQTLNVQTAETNAQMPSSYSVEGEATALHDTLAYLKIRHQVDIVGSSYGAVVALHFAVMYPDQVKTVTLFEPPEFWVLPETEYANDPALHEMRELMTQMEESTTPSDQQLFRFRCILDSCPPAIPSAADSERRDWDLSRLAMRGLAATFRHREDLAQLKRLARSKPILLVHGSNTVSFHRRINEVLARELPEVETAEIEGGHSAPRTNASAFLEMVRAFLLRHP